MDLAVRTEIQKLAELLQVEQAELNFAEQLDADTLQTLRSQINTSILNKQSHIFEKLARTSRFMPAKLSALMAEKVFGPMPTAYMTYYYPPEKAIAISRKLSAEFMAEVTRHIVPEKAIAMMDAMPLSIMKPIVKEMLRREEYFVMGNFVDWLAEDVVVELTAEVDSYAAMLSIASFVRRKERLSTIVAGYSDDMLLGLMHTAETENMWPEVLALTTHLQPAQKTRIATLCVQLSPGALAAAAATAQELGLVDKLGDAYQALI